MKTIEVVGAIIRKDDEILIAQRIKGEFAGQWEFPGGKIEPGETPEEALYREILEEMELHIEVKDFLMIAEWDYSDFHLKMHCYYCDLKNEEIHLHDHTAIRWISIDRLDEEIDWVPADRQVMDAILKDYQKRRH